MFKRKTASNLPTEPVAYPVGTFAETEKGYFYIASPSKRYRITTKRVLDSWSPARVVKTNEKALSKYRIAAKMPFRNGSLIHSIADGKIYLIVNKQRCHMTSPEAFERIGAVRDRTEVMSVSLDEINLHEEGAPLA